MADQVSTLVQRLRVLIGDMNDDVNEHRYSDLYLKKVIRVAYEQDTGLQSIGIGGTLSSGGNSYTEYTLDSLSDAGLSLCALAAAIMLFEAELRQYIADGGGMSIAIGPNSSDEKSVIQAMQKLLSESKSDFRKAIADYRLGAGNLNIPVRIDLYATGVVD